jgi:hypothetical protein
MTTVLNGLLGGLVAAVVAAAVARTLRDEPSAASALVAAAWDDGATRPPPWAGLVAELSYGGVAGGALVVVVLSAGGFGVPPTVAEAFAATLGWSAALFGAAGALWTTLDLPLTRARLRDLAVFHLAYGLALGAWIRATWIT